MVVCAIDNKSRIAQVAPEDCRHTQLVSFVKSYCDFLNLPARLLRTKINSCSNSDCSHFPCLLNGTEKDLVVMIRIAQELVVVDLDDHWNLVSVSTGDRAEHAKSGGNSV